MPIKQIQGRKLNNINMSFCSLYRTHCDSESKKNERCHKLSRTIKEHNF